MKSENAYLILLGIITVLFSTLLFDYSIPVFWAIIFSILFSPMHSAINRYINRPSLSSCLTLICILLIVILPSFFILAAITNEIYQILSNIESGQYDIQSFTESAISVLPILEQTIEKLGINIETIGQQLNDFAYGLAQFSYSAVIRASENIVNFVISLLVMVYLLFFFLRDGKTILDACIEAFPMEDRQEIFLLDEFNHVTKATIKGTFLVALSQGFLGFIILTLLNVQGAVLWGFIMALFSILPGIGTAIVWLPIALVLFYKGLWINASILIFSGFFIIGIVDNLLRPYLISKETKLPDYLVLLTTIGGISLFGISGFVLGPIIAALFISLWSLMKQMNT